MNDAVKAIRTYFEEFWFVVGDAGRDLPRVFGLFVFAAGLDIVGLSLFVPLVMSLNSGTPGSDAPDGFFGAKLMQGSAALTLCAVAAIAVFAGRALVAVYVQSQIVKFGECHRARLMERLMRAYLDKPYEFHLQRNSADLANTVQGLTGLYVGGTLILALRLATEILSFAAIVTFLAFTNLPVLLVTTFFLGASLTVYLAKVQKVVARAGAQSAQSAGEVIKTVNHGLGALREIRLLGREDFLLRELRRHAEALADSQARFGALQTIPRLLLETTLISLLSLLAVLAADSPGLQASVVPTLGVFAVASLRLLPGATTMAGAVNSMRNGRYILGRLAADLRELDATATRARSTLPQTTAKFASLELRNISYRYPGAAQPALRGLNFSICAGEAVGIIGRSGSGKSTFADLCLGLLAPQEGEVLVDGRPLAADACGWMRHVAYIPQSIFLFDDTLLRNITLEDRPDRVDHARLDRVLKAALLDEIVTALPAGLETFMGERGVRLSGGQRQRVALARALYFDREFIVMDEATSALDNETERELVRAIHALHGQRTLLVIAHRSAALEGCDRILTMDGGRLNSVDLESGS